MGGGFRVRAFGVIDKTIRQLGAYIQSVKDANQRIEIIEPVLLVRATQSAGENYSSKTMHILETEKKRNPIAWRQISHKCRKWIIINTMFCILRF